MNEKIPQWAQQRIDEAREKGLTRLDLSGRGKDEKLTTVPDALTQLTNLQKLDLGYNQLTVVPAALTQLTNLQVLYLHDNQLTTVPAAIIHLANLQELRLDGNQLTAVPAALTQLTNLQVLRLSSNQLTAVPTTVTQLANLESLYLSDNQLTTVPAAIVQLTNLRVLDLRGNQLTAMPNAIAQLSNLRELNLRGNHLSVVPTAIAKLSQLERLDLDSNWLTTVPVAIGQLSKLKELYLSSNRLTSIPDTIAQLSDLQGLYLSDNELTAVPYSIIQLSNLQRLYLNDNQLTAVPDFIIQLTNLQTLDLSGNSLTIVPSYLAKLPKLKTLYLFQNPIVKPPPETLKLEVYKPVNLKALFAYFRQQQEAGITHLYEAKLLIVGEPGAGKTSLTRKLISNTIPLSTSAESTEGIDIHRWMFPLFVVRDWLSKNRDSSDDIPSSVISDPQFRVNIWDFGGQEIYHATHQFFLSRRSLYVVVADAREQKTDFFHWLDLIEHLSDRSPVFIFNNEKQNQHWAINEQQIKAHFPDTFQTTFSFNLAEDVAGLNHLRQKIQQQISQLPHVGNELPATWVNVRNALEKDERHTITQVEFLRLCEDNGFTRRTDALQLSGYLHDLGVILHFQDDPLLKHTVIIQPEWGTDAAYGVLNNAKVKGNYGRFSCADLHTIWHGDEYTSLHDELLMLMKRFQLCYEIPQQKGWYIAPQLLREQPPDYQLTVTENGLHLRYKYEAFMPKGLLSRFIVVMHPWIAGEGHWVWRSGVVLEKEGAQAEVMEFYHRREIRVSVTGHNRKELITIVSHELDKLHAPFHRLKFDKLVPCHCPTCQVEKEPNFYRLDILKTRLAHGKAVIECDKPPFHTVNIWPLINDVGAGTQEDLSRLLCWLEDTFDEEELKRLCFDLRVEYQDLEATGRSGKMRELIRYLERHGRVQEFVELAGWKRPYQAW